MSCEPQQRAHSPQVAAGFFNINRFSRVQHVWTTFRLE